METYKLHFIPLGGVVGVTKNMYVYEIYQDEILKDIIIVDCGIGFPKEKELGVDLVIPDISYLADKKDKIRAILFSHGHEDHTSALPYHYAALGQPPIFASKLTCAFVQNKFKETGLKPKITEITYEREYEFGSFKVEFVRMTHSIPDTTHIIIRTPVGVMYHGTDFKLDLTPPYGQPPDFYRITKAGHEGVLCLLSDCLGAEREGLTLSENIVGQTFEDEMRKTKGKFIMTTFSSNISRIHQCVDAAIKFNRKIIFLGRSMKDNTRLAREIKYLPIPESLVGKEEEAMKLPPNKVCLIVAGSQGQFGSALSKLSAGQNKNITVKPGDKVIFSSDPIPGNEDEVYSVIEELSERGADVVYSDIQDQLHASGHGNQEDMKFLARFTNPRYFIPIGGTVRHQRQYLRLMTELGFAEKDIFLLKEGNTMWFTKNRAYPGDTVETKNIFVDAYGVGDIGNIVLRDRKTLSSEGMVVAFAMVDSMGRLSSRPVILSRGFVFEKGEEKLFEGGIIKIEQLFKPNSGHVFDTIRLKSEIGKTLEEYFHRERGRNPLVVVEIIQV